MNIGQAAKASGVSRKMIRYYEEIKLIPAPTRTQSGYRAYSTNDVRRLRFVRHARDLGFSLDTIKDLLGLWAVDARTSHAVKKVAETHAAGLRQRIAELQHMVDTLQELMDGCANNEHPDCLILNTLAKHTDAAQD